MKRLIVLLAVAIAIPTSVAFAKGSPGTHGKSNPKVMYILKGMLTSYTPASTAGDGSVTIKVLHSNYHARALKGKELPFTVTTGTRITFPNGATTLNTPVKGVVKFRAPLRFAAGTDLATTLPTMAKALHIIDQARH